MAKSISRRLADSASPTGAIDGTLSTAAQTNITSLGTLSALTVSGDLTVDTSTLKVDSTNNRVGIGNSSPASLLDVSSTGEVISTVRSTSTSGARQATLRLNVPSTGGDDPAGRVQFTYGTGYTVAGSIEMSHTNTAMKFLTGTTERMRIDSSGNVGINQSSPAFALCISDDSNPNRNGMEIAIGTSDTAGNTIQNYNRATSAYTPLNIAGSVLTFGVGTNATERMRIDSSGNVGVGVTPNAWISGWKAVQTSAASLYSQSGAYGGLQFNSYYDGNWRTQAAGYGGVMQFNAATGSLTFYNSTAATGAAGSAYALSGERMTLAASGNVGIGATPLAWGSTVVGLDVGSAGSFWGTKTGSTLVAMSDNSYFNGSAYIARKHWSRFQVLPKCGSTLLG